MNFQSAAGFSSLFFGRPTAPFLDEICESHIPNYAELNVLLFYLWIYKKIYLYIHLDIEGFLLSSCGKHVAVNCGAPIFTICTT